MKKLLIIALTIIMLFTLTISTHTHANPYCTYRGGNCTYFTWECINTYWEMTPDIPRSWNACDWVQLIGQEKDGYKIIQVDTPQPGDVFILPSNPEQYRGHCGFITTVGKNYTFEKGIPAETYYRVLESAMYPEESFIYKLGICKYRIWYYGNQILKMRFL